MPLTSAAPQSRLALRRRQYGDAWHLLAYPWQPQRAQIVADEFCREQGYLQAGTARPFSLPAAMVTLVSRLLRLPLLVAICCAQQLAAVLLQC